MNTNIIQDEINKNGNTNLITHSGLTSGSQIFAIGDSHTIFFYNSMKIKEHWCCGVGSSLTMYALLRYGMDIYELGNQLGNGHEKYNIKEDDYVLFYYGFNDIQRNINLHSKNNWNEQIETLCLKYITYVQILREKYKIKPIVPCVYPNPRPGAEGQNPCGTYEERRHYTLYANKMLSLNCKNNNIPFLNIYDHITDDNGFIKENITSDLIHLDYNNKEIKDYVETEIYKFCY